MGFSFIVIDKQNLLNITEFISFVKTRVEEFEIIYCSSNKLCFFRKRKY